MDLIAENRLNLKRSSTIIGISFLLMFVLGIFAEFAVRIQLIQWDNALVTYENLKRNLALFNSGIFAWLVIIFLDLVVMLAFYNLLNATDKLLALLMASLRMLYVATKSTALIGLTLAQDVVVKGNNNTLMETYTHQTMQLLKMHSNGFSIALFFFGIHLITLALLFQKERVMPKILVWLLLAGGAGYSLNSLATLFWQHVEMIHIIILIIFMLPMAFSELLAGLWLWFRRKNIRL